jgi:predicted alpha-1,2-mannosidase
MKSLILSSLCLLTLSVNSQKLTNYIDPMIGSGGHGHVFVGASAPFGAVKLGPENFYKGWDWCSGYHYGDSILIGFSHTHLSGTGIGDLSDILVMPYTGSVKLDKGKEAAWKEGYGSHYSHKNEKVKPGYYSVMLDDYRIKAELSATERVGIHRYSFPRGADAHIIIDLKEGINDKTTDSYIELTDPYTIKGYRFSSGWAREQQVFFAVKSSVPLTGFVVYDDTKELRGKSGKGTAIRGLISFDKSPGTVMLKVGISPVSPENALKNIEAEIPHWNLEKTVSETEEKWNREISSMIAKTTDEHALKIFYTALYHAMMHPSIFNDHNNAYQGTDNRNYDNAPFTNYSVFSTWDTYRAAHPLYLLTNTDRVNDFINSMLAIFDQQGMLPVWHLQGYETGTMVGISSLQVIAEAYLKGYRGFDAEKAYNAIKKTSMSTSLGLDYVQKLQPIPSDSRVGRPVARALEYSIADGSIALMAKAMGKKDDYEYFMKRSQNYRLYYDREAGFFRGKLQDGKWNPVFDPFKSTKPYATDYAEGNAWQYLWLVPQDVEGLIKLLGGEKEFLKRLDTFFTIESKDAEVLVDLTGLIGQYAHGNEPGHHIAYLYSFAGQQWKTAEKVHKIVSEFYHDAPDGIIGNEDCGQMSAWYIFSAMGFYPVFPASGIYVFGSPSFDEITLNVGNNKKFRIETEGNKPGNIYIQSVMLNSKNYTKSYITHEDIISGGTLKFRMGSKPNFEFGSKPADRPVSMPGL